MATTESSPTVPFVTARSTRIETVAGLHIALVETIADRALADARYTVSLTDIIPGGMERFEAARAIDIAAIATDYPGLR